MKEEAILKLKKIKIMLVIGVITSSSSLTFLGTVKANTAAFRITPASEIKKRIDTAPGEVLTIQYGDTVEEFGKATGKTNQEIAKLNHLKLNGDERNLQVGIPFARTPEEAKLIAKMPEKKRVALSVRAANSLIEYDTIEKAKEAIKNSTSVSGALKKASQAAALTAHTDTYRVFNRNGRSLKKVLQDTRKVAQEIDKKLKKENVSVEQRKQMSAEASGRIAAAATKTAIDKPTQKAAAKAVAKEMKKSQMKKNEQKSSAVVESAEQIENTKVVQAASTSAAPNPEPNNADTPKPTEGEAKLAASSEVSLDSAQLAGANPTEENATDEAATEAANEVELNVGKQDNYGNAVTPTFENTGRGEGYEIPFAKGVSNSGYVISVNEATIEAVTADMQGQTDPNAAKKSIIKFNFSRKQFASQMYLHVAKKVKGKYTVVQNKRIICSADSSSYQIVVPDEWFKDAENGLEIKFYDQKTNKYYPEEKEQIYRLLEGQRLVIDAKEEEVTAPQPAAASTGQAKPVQVLSNIAFYSSSKDVPWPEGMCIQVKKKLISGEIVNRYFTPPFLANDDSKLSAYKMLLTEDLFKDAENDELRIRFYSKDSSDFIPKNKKFFTIKKGGAIGYSFDQHDEKGEYVRVGVTNQGANTYNLTTERSYATD